MLTTGYLLDARFKSSYAVADFAALNEMSPGHRFVKIRLASVRVCAHSSAG
jgi:hypothetical protein